MPSAHPGPGGSRQGFILHVAASLLILVAILVFAYNAFVRGDAQQTFRALDALTADTLALSAMNAALARLAALPADGEFTPGRAVDLALAADPLGRKLADACRERYGAPLELSGAVTVLDRRPFPLRRETGLVAPPDPGECEGTLLVEVEVGFRGVRRRWREVRAYKLASTQPPVYPHFTLFVRDAGAGGPDAYNVVENDDAGNVTGPVAPLFLDHGNHLTAPLERRGWVYLGSGEVTLCLAQGAAGCGESFHFTGEPTRIDLPDPGTILVNRYAGFYGGLKDEPCVEGAAAHWRSAWLKLFGDDAARSLTLVLGDVKRAYLRFSALFAVADGRIRFLRLLDRVGPEGSGLSTSDDGPPVTVTDYEAYAAHMSDIVTTPYNVSFDFLYDLKMNLAPSPLPPRWLECDDHLRGLLGDGAGAYPCDAKAVPLESATGGLYFEGDLARFTAWPHLADRVGPAFPSGRDLLARVATAGGTLGGVCRVAGDLDLTPLADLKGGGAILCDGDVTVGPLASDRPLYLVSRHGDLRVKGRLVNVGLAAEEGRLRSEAPLDVEGCVAAKSVRPEANKAGGRIAYPLPMNPRAPEFVTRRALMIAPVAAAGTARFAR